MVNNYIMEITNLQKYEKERTSKYYLYQCLFNVKLVKEQNLTADTTCKICKAFDCDFKDIVEFVNE